MGGTSQLNRSADLLTTLDAYRAMHSFLEAYWERGDKTDDGLASLLSSTALDVLETGTADPAQWSDWLEAIDRTR